MIILAGVAAYGNSLRAPFLFDDLESVVENPTIRQLWPLSRPLSPPPSTPTAGRPVTNFSFALNYAIGGLDPLGYHIVNLSVHLACALLLFALLRRTLALPRLHSRARGSPEVVAFCATLLWTVHPLLTESVTYVTQRSELLMASWFLLMLYAVVRSAEAPAPQRGWQVAAVAACALGMASKEVMVVAVLVAWLYDAMFLSESDVGTWRERRGLHLALAATWGLLAVLVSGTKHRVAGFQLPDITPVQYLLTQCGVILHYLRLAVWPQPLVLDYRDWPLVRSPADAWPSILGMAVVIGLLVWALHRRRPEGFVGAWLLLILAPTSSVLPISTEVVAERRMYLPLAGLIAWATAVGSWLLARWLPAGFRGCAAALLVGVAVLALSGMTIRRNSDYRDPITMWQTTLTQRPTNPRVHDNLGWHLQEAGRLDEAVRHHAEAVRLAPRFAWAHSNLGVALTRLGRYDEALPHLRMAVRLRPELAHVQANLAAALTRMGVSPANRDRLEEALAAAHEAVRLNPPDAEFRTNLGALLEQTGQLEEAVSHHREAIRLRPDLPEAHINLGLALAKQGKIDDAIAALQTALHLKPQAPGNRTVWSNLGVLLERAGRAEAAAASYRQALELRPGLAEARVGLGRVLALEAAQLMQQGRPREAIDHYRRALAMTPDLGELHDGLSLALAADGQLDQALAHAGEAVRLAPEDATIRSNAGSLLMERGRLDEAIVQYQEALRLQPDSVEAHNNLGVALVSQQRWVEAKAEFSEALRLQPNDSQASANLTQLLREHPELRASP